MKKLLPVILLLFFYSDASGQNDIKQQCRMVLEKLIPDSVFAFGQWKANGSTGLQLKYLGTLTTKKGKVFKLVNSIFLWGLSNRSTNRILLFGKNNSYLGNYNVGNTTALPDKLRNGKLIFNNAGNTNCDQKLTTIIDLSNGLPNRFFISCKGKSGDFYAFSPE